MGLDISRVESWLLRLLKEEVRIWAVIRIRMSKREFKSRLKMKGNSGWRAKERVLLKRVSKDKRFLNRKRFSRNK